MKSTTTRKIITVLCALAMVFLGIWLVSLLFNQKAEQPTYLEFLEQVEEGKVQAVYFDGNYTMRVLVNEGEKEHGVNNTLAKFPASYDYALNIPSRVEAKNDIFAAIEKRNAVIEEENKKINADNEGKPESEKKPLISSYTIMMDFNKPDQVSIWDYLFPLLILGTSIVIVIVLLKKISQQNNQNINFGRSKARVNENVKVRFTDVAGAEEEKEELAEIIDFLKAPAKFNELGARIPRGVLLVGPPGTGKTLFAKAVAGEAGVPFFSISGSDFVEMFVGVGASRVRDLFDQAKRNMPCIVFIDEIDAVGRQRGAGLGGGHDEREQTLNQLLVEMDGFETNNGIIIMAATNRADILDPALLRPGRFDRQIYVNRPDVRGREAILKVHARNKPMASDVDFKTIARITSGFSGADLENLLNEAAILAVRDGRKSVAMKDVAEGINKVLMGPQKKSRLVTESDKRITAYHEAGHAILACKLKYCDPVQEVTIIPRGMAVGYTMTRPENDDNHQTKAQLIDQITMTLGGRVAEELVIQNITSGASGDIKSLTGTVHSMVAEWGMSDVIGPIYYGSDHEVFVGKNYQAQNNYSESIASKIDEESNRIVSECHKRATEILKENIEVLHNMARVLLEKETIHTDEVDMLINGESAETVINFIDKKYNPDKPSQKPQAEEKSEKTVEEVVEKPKQIIAPKEEDVFESKDDKQDK